MKNITYRPLTREECHRIEEIDASQFIHRAYREVDGRRVLVTISYQDPTWPEGYEAHLHALHKTLSDDGFAIGAFSEEGALLGFISLNRPFFGKTCHHVLLDQLFITLSHRRKGIGKALFQKAADIARSWEADKLYICAGSAEETVNFYFALGCREALEINPTFYEEDPRDFQLEYDLSK
ncbi:GNAT family N-acetyltransferase [Proteiniclasticum sp. C24MP]|uniref:GNAT family N-acetyltransferase n=1 Tax=Proteiniclasticum sp. C24MP TaxID=3374101 RepID=UPI003755004B